MASSDDGRLRSAIRDIISWIRNPSGRHTEQRADSIEVAYRLEQMLRDISPVRIDSACDCPTPDCIGYLGEPMKVRCLNCGRIPRVGSVCKLVRRGGIP